MATKKKNQQNEYKILDLACGGVKTEGAIGIDRLKLPGVDVVHNLDKIPYPFKDNTFDKVVSYNGMEHLEDPLSVLVELHRICKNGAIIRIESPHFSSADYYTDPTHKHPFSSRSFDYVIPGTKLHELHYQNIQFKKRIVRITFHDVPKFVEKALNYIANYHTMFYERHLAFILQGHQIIFELEVVK